MKEFDYPLSEEIEYSHDGETKQASFIKLIAPSAKQLMDCAELKQAFFRASKEHKSDTVTDDDESDGEVTGSDVMSLLYASDSVDIKKVLIRARELLTSGVCLVDGMVKLSKPLFDALSNDDVEDLIGEYLVNFILSSILKDKK